MWTIREEVTQQVRHVNQAMSGGSFVAIFRLRVVPNPDRGIAMCESGTVDETIKRALPFIEEGLRLFIDKRDEVGRPVGDFALHIKEGVEHDDFKGWRFSEATMMALREIFTAHEVVAT